MTCQLANVNIARLRQNEKEYSMHVHSNPLDKMVNRANQLCLIRFLMAVIAVFILYYLPGPKNSLLAASLIFTSVLFDAVDGALARKLGISGEIGSLTDIYTDHAVANTLWIAFAVFGCISLWVPIITSTRDLLVDYLRQITAVATGKNCFAQVANQKFSWLVSSRFMRAFYGSLKLTSWCLLALSCYLNAYLLELIIPYLIWSTCLVCIIRAIPSISVGWPYAVYYWPTTHQ